MRKWGDLKNLDQHIDRRLEKQSSEQIERNRLLLKVSIENVKFLAMQEKAAKNAKYISVEIQREILKIIAGIVKDKIREEIGESKFCILVDEAIDESNKEQMATILRYVDRDGFIRERFFEVVHVENTSALTLKKEICNVFNQYNLLIENLRGQGYDGTSNMRGEWNGLLALFLKDSPHAYYIHSFAHRLQLALVAVSKEVHDVCRFFSTLTSSINFVVSILLQDLVDKGLNSNIRGDAKVLGISEKLCQTLQKNDIDILNAMNLVSTTRINLQQIRDGRWEEFLWIVIKFCESNDIEVPDYDDCYARGTKYSCQLKNNITVHDNYHFEIFNVVIDFLLIELNERFLESTMELLTLTNALSPVDGFRSFSLCDICSLVDKFYYHDFSQEEREDLMRELYHYKFDVPLSTATTERAFSGMKLIKTSLRNKMGNDFLANTMVVHIERDIALVQINIKKYLPIRKINSGYATVYNHTCKSEIVYLV
ncbi:uncharacterized protein LOC142541925 [Primulina tabacum]|uniref:uncharacterized protein LOC142541925 n=1 Tax=Primulina tabacum TaxID=48773 RepID=UPI003F59F5E1